MAAAARSDNVSAVQTRVPGFFPTLYEIVERLYRHWDHTASIGGVTDAVQDLTRFTVDVTSTLCFGQDINTLNRATIRSRIT